MIHVRNVGALDLSGRDGGDERGADARHVYRRHSPQGLLMDWMCV